MKRLFGMIDEAYKAASTRITTGELNRFVEQIPFETAKNEGWTVNIVLYGAAYVLAVACWFWFDATKPVAPEEGGSPDGRRQAPPETVGPDAR